MPGTPHSAAQLTTAWVAACLPKVKIRALKGNFLKPRMEEKDSPWWSQPSRCRGLRQGPGLVSGPGTKIPRALWHAKKLSPPTYNLTLEACKHLWEV